MSKKNKRNNPFLALLLCACVINESASARPDAAGSGERRGPPPQAYQACADGVVGDSCEMTGRRGERLQGACINPGEEPDALVCAPEGGRGGERRPVGDEE